jgi:hypothetical protein
MPDSGDEDSSWDTFDVQLTTELGQAKQDLKDAIQTARDASKEHAKTWLQDKLATQPRVAHRAIFAEESEHTGRLDSIIHHRTGEEAVDGPGVLKACQDFFQDLMNTTLGDNPNETFPWSKAGAPDPFELKSPATDSMHTAQLMHDVSSKTAYFETVRTLSRNKSPGPDGIPNELLKILPPLWHESSRAVYHLLGLWLHPHPVESVVHRAAVQER